MSATIQLLERFKDFHRLPSDYAAAKLLGIRQNTISKWRAGGSMDDATALKIAQELALDPLAVLAQIYTTDRQLTARDRAIWSRYCARVLVAAVATVALSAQFPNDAAAAVTQFTEIPQNGTTSHMTTYTLCAERVRRRRFMTRFLAAIRATLQTLRDGPAISQRLAFR